VTSVVQIISIAVSIGFLAVVLELVRRRKLSEEYSLIWIICAAALLVLSLWRDSLHVLAQALGVFYPPAVLLLVLALFVLIACLSFSVVLSRQAVQIERLTEEIALLAARQRDVDARDAEPPSATRR
jgi:hypothetical protein